MAMKFIPDDFSTQQSTASVDDYSNSIDPRTILNDPRFLNDLRDYFESKGVSSSYMTEQELVDRFYKDKTFDTLNTVSAIGAAWEAGTASQTERERMRRMEQVWRQLPNFWQEGGRGWGAALADGAQAILTDPVNLIPGASAMARGGQAARAAVVAGTSPTRAAIMQGARTGALSEGLISAGQEAVINTAEQSRDVSLDLRDDFSMGELAGRTAIGGAMGAGVGAIIGAPAGYMGGRNAGAQVDAARFSGLVDREIAGLTNQAADSLVGATGPFARPEQVQANADAATAANQPPPPAPEVPVTEQRINEMVGQLQGFDSTLTNTIRDMRAQYDDIAETSPELAEEMMQAIINLDTIAGMIQRLKASADEIQPMLESNEGKGLGTATSRAARLERDFAEARRLLRIAESDEDPAAVANQIRSSIEARMNAEAAAKAAEEAAKNPPAAAAEAAPTAPSAAPDAPAPAPEAAAPAPVPLTEPARRFVEAEGLDPTLFAGQGTGRNGVVTLGDIRRIRTAPAATEAVTPDAAVTPTPEVAATPDVAPSATTPAAVETPAARITDESRARALLGGLDYRSLAPNKRGTIPPARIETELGRRADKEPDAYAATVQRELAEMLDLIDPDMDAAEAGEILAVLARGSEVTSSPEDIMAVYRYLSSEDPSVRVDESPDGQPITKGDRELEEILAELYPEGFDGSVKTESADTSVSLTETEKKKIARMSKQLVREKGLPKVIADSVAQYKVVRDRGTPSSSGIRNTAGRIEDAANLTTAGRNSAGQIQAFLKRGMPIAKGSDYTVTGGNRVNVAEFGFDEAMYKAKSGKGPDIVPFKLTGQQTVQTMEGPVKMKKGTVAYADAITGKAYDSMELALRYRGEYKAPPAVKPAVANWRDLLAKYAGDPAGLRAELTKNKSGQTAAAKTNEAPKPPKPTKKTNPAPKPGEGAEKLAIIRLKSNPQDVRMISPRQVANGKTIQDVMGKHDDPDLWDFRYTTEPFTFNEQKKREIFDRAPEADAPNNPDGLSTAPGLTTGRGNPISQRELYDMDVTDMLTADEIAVVNRAIAGDSRITDGGQSWNTGMAMDRVSGARFLSALNSIESNAWPKNKAEMTQRIKDIITMNQALEKVSPEGIRLDVVSREKSIESLKDYFTAYAPEELESATRLMERMIRDTGPIVSADRGNSYRMNFASAGLHTGTDYPLARVTLMTEKLSESYTPRTLKLAHEMAHWAYFNVLSAKDRVDFWKSMEKYYDADGNLDMEKVRGGLPMKGQQEVTVEKTGQRYSVNRNSETDPQEFFANQFEAYILRKMNGEPAADEAYWQRVVRYVKAIFDRYLNGVAIDPDLERLFAKIIPDEAVEAKFKLGVDSVPTKEAGKYIQSRFLETKMVMKDLDAAIESDSADGILNAFTEFTRLMFSLHPRNYDGSSGTFWPLRKLSPMMRQRAGDVDEIIRGRPVNERDAFEPENLQRLQEEISGRIMNDPQAIADTLSDFYRNGYNGSWQPANGIPPKIVRKEMTSIRALLDMISNQLEWAYGRVENGKLPPGSTPEKPKQEVKPSKVAKQAEKKAAREAAAAENLAKADAAKKPAERIDPTKVMEVDPEFAASLKNLSYTELMKQFIAERGTARGSQIGQEIIYKINSSPVPATPVPVTRDIFEMDQNQLKEALLDGLANGDVKRVGMISYTMQRNLENYFRTATGRPLIDPVFADIKNAINMESADSIGVPDVPGIPASARAGVREILSYMNHRDPQIDYTLKTMTYRMLNLLGRTAKGELEDANLLTVREMQILAGVASDTSIELNQMAPFTDFRSLEFKNLRTEMRRMAIGINHENANPFNVMRSVAHLITRANVLGEEDMAVIYDAYFAAGKDARKISRTISSKGMPFTELERANAHGWFAEELTKYMAEQVSRGDVLRAVRDNDISRLTLKSKFAYAIDHAAEAVAYLVNGLLGRKSMKQVFRRVTFYGDMFGSGRSSGISPSRTRIGSPGEYAAAAYEDMRRSFSSDKLSKIKAYVSGGLSDGGDKPIVFYHASPAGAALRQSDVVLNPSVRGLYGPGVYVSMNPRTATEVYGFKSTPLAISRQIEDSNLDDALKAELIESAEELYEIRIQVSEARVEMTSLNKSDLGLRTSSAMRSALGEDPLLSREQLVRKIDMLLEREQSIISNLEANGIKNDPITLPLVLSVRNPVDFTNRTLYEINEDNEILNIVYDYFVGADDTGRLANEFINQLPIRFPSAMDFGDDFYFNLMDAIYMAGRDTGLDDPKGLLAHLLKENGYDGILTNHRNTESFASNNVAADGLGYRSSSVTHEVVVVFDSNNVKHVNAEEFDAADPRLYGTPVMPTGFVGNIVSDYIDTPELTTSHLVPSMVGDQLETSGTPKGVSSAIMSMIKGRGLNAKEESAIRKAGPLGFLRSQSQRMHDMGAHFLAKFHEDNFPRIHNHFAKKYMPIHEMLQSLPDAESAVRSWARKSTGGLLSEQPKSYQRIVRALRRGDDSRQAKSLTAEERKVYNAIRETFAGELKELRQTGMMVGNRGKNYVPQVWNVEKIRAARIEFMDKMSQYYKDEHAMYGRDAPTDEEAKAFADRMYHTLAGEEADGTFIPVKGGSRNPRFEHTDYARMIELDKVPDALNQMEKFLEDDLEFLLVKYLEGSTRKVQHINHMGINSHVMYDYLHVAEKGQRGISDLLSKNKIIRREVNAKDLSGVPHEVEFVETIRMPFVNNEGGAYNFAGELIATYQSKGAEAARAMLMSQDVRDFMGRPSKLYKQRVDGIVAALSDFKGQPRVFEDYDYIFMQDALSVAMKRPHSQSGSRKAKEISQGLRTFNNITLLGFTTLTSLGDLGLPLIRSGSFSSWAKSLKQLATDPDYARYMNRVGVSMENILHERMTYMYGAADNKLSSAFFNATLLTPWTDMNRKIGGAVGYETFKLHQERANKYFKPGVDIKDQHRHYKTAHRFLNRYGLQEFLPTGTKKNVGLTDITLLDTDDALREAVLKFTDEVIFQPNPNDIPLWAQTPVGALVFQLKSFPLMMMRMSSYILTEAFKHGNVKPLAYLATLGPAFGMGAMAVKDVVQARGGEDNRETKLRDRSAADVPGLNKILEGLGYSEELHGDMYSYLGWYVEGMLVMGGLGLVGELLHSAAEQVDNGAYGQIRTASSLFGPTFGLGMSGMTVAAGIVDDKDNSNAKERSAVRETVARVPIVGGIRSAREGITDAVAGESSTAGGGSSGGWGSGGWE
jgi:hypothetical protein